MTIIRIGPANLLWLARDLTQAAARGGLSGVVSVESTGDGLDITLPTPYVAVPSLRVVRLLLLAGLGGRLRRGPDAVCLARVRITRDGKLPGAVALTRGTGRRWEPDALITPGHVIRHDGPTWVVHVPGPAVPRVLAELERRPAP